MPKDLRRRLKNVEQQLKKSAVDIYRAVTTELILPLAKEVITITPLPQKVKEAADKVVDKVENKVSANC